MEESTRGGEGCEIKGTSDVGRVWSVGGNAGRVVGGIIDGGGTRRLDAFARDFDTGETAP